MEVTCKATFVKMQKEYGADGSNSKLTFIALLFAVIILLSLIRCAVFSNTILQTCSRIGSGKESTIQLGVL